MIGLDIGEESMGWDIEEEFSPEASGWAEKVHVTIPRIEEDEMVVLRRVEKKINQAHADRYSEGKDKDPRTEGNQTASDADELGASD